MKQVFRLGMQLFLFFGYLKPCADFQLFITVDEYKHISHQILQRSAQKTCKHTLQLADCDPPLASDREISAKKNTFTEETRSLS